MTMTRMQTGATVFLATSLLASTALAAPQETAAKVAGGTIITPAASQRQAAGLAHTNIHIFRPSGQAGANAQLPTGYYENPQSLACLYRLVKPITGCNPQTLTATAQGGSKVVILVDAYDDPTATNDLTAFSTQYGLPPITAKNFQVVYAGGTKPPPDSTGGWELEESLDIEMAHSLAPQAKVILVEANSNSYSDLFAAVTVAAGLATKAGGGEVSNSYGGAEFGGEESYEKVFKGKDVVFFAAAGDLPGVEVPSAFSNVVGVGGTQVNRDNNGNYVDQETWYSTGGGFSEYVPLPSYQVGIKHIKGSFRGVPDVALDAAPASGVWVYDTTPYGGDVLDWVVVGGTSVASPSVAAIVNNAQSFAANSAAELATIYANLGVRRNFTDIRAGECDNGGRLQFLNGWDTCTGVGTPNGKQGK
jgi:subtilase family serine protease